MKMKKLTSAIAIVFIIGCGKSGNQDEIKYYDVERSDNTKNQQSYFVNDASNHQLAMLQYKPEQNIWEISMGDDFWYGEIKNDKRKFYDKSGEVYAEIKFKDEGFKLRNPQGDLIWKVKISGEKIKISDNEEMTNAFEIKKKSEYFANLNRNEQALGSIELSPQNTPAVIKSEDQTFYLTGPENNNGAAILLIDEIQPAHQLMILAQLIEAN